MLETNPRCNDMDRFVNLQQCIFVAVIGEFVGDDNDVDEARAFAPPLLGASPCAALPRWMQLGVEDLYLLQMPV
jgi:hypothetical protein